MPSSSLGDLVALLTPISDDALAGVNLRQDPSGPYFKLKDARGAARAAERRADGAGERGVRPAEWQLIATLAHDVLAEQSKDLEIAVWYAEALLRLEGFAGLRLGFGVLRGLIEQYWESMFSLEDEEGLITRLRPLAGLNGEGAEGALIQPIRMAPLTAPGDDGPLSAYDYGQAQTLLQISDPEARARRTDSGAVTIEQFITMVNTTGAAFYIELLDDLRGCVAEFEALALALYERAGRDAPPTSTIKDMLRTVLDIVESTSRDLVAMSVAASAADGEAAMPQSETGSTPGAAPARAGPVASREEALRVLLQVAEYFKVAEPHSPISSSLQEIVRRARLPFAELLAELLPDHEAWRTALTSAGIRPPDPSE